jgi:hypothetical protein
MTTATELRARAASLRLNSQPRTLAELQKAELQRYANALEQARLLDAAAAAQETIDAAERAERVSVSA